MRYSSKQMEKQAVLDTASRMCAAARTAPKARGLDNILTIVLTGVEKNALADKMNEISQREFGDKPSFFLRDANNLYAAQAVVLIGVKLTRIGLPYCGFCGFGNCKGCQDAGGRCAFNLIDLGIAVCSAVSIASDSRVDNRVMFSVGKAAEEMGYDDPLVLWHGIPLSISGKNIFFDRKP